MLLALGLALAIIVSQVAAGGVEDFKKKVLTLKDLYSWEMKSKEMRDAFSSDLDKLLADLDALAVEEQEAAEPLVVKVPETEEELIRYGKELFQRNCSLCHGTGKEGGRGPSLLDDSWTWGKRDEDIYRWMVEGIPTTSMGSFAAKLTEGQMWTVVAYIQNDYQGVPEKKPETSALPKAWELVKKEAELAATMAESGGAVGAMVDKEGKTPEQIGELLMSAMTCTICHKLKEAGNIVGPSLWDVGAKRDERYLLEKLVNPTKELVPGYPGDVMEVGMRGVGFYDKLSIDELKAMVAYMMSLKGGQTTASQP